MALTQIPSFPKSRRLSLLSSENLKMYDLSFSFCNLSLLLYSISSLYSGISNIHYNNYSFGHNKIKLVYHLIKMERKKKYHRVLTIAELSFGSPPPCSSFFFLIFYFLPKTFNHLGVLIFS